MDSTISTLNLFSSNISSVSGFDKALALIQFTAKMTLLLRMRTGFYDKSDTTARLSNLSRVINDARTIFRFRGSLPLISQSLDTVFTSRKKTHITNIQRAQLISMLLYHPLEHAYWLGSHGILAIKPETIGKAALWSCRAWMTYNLLELMNISKKFKTFSLQETSEAQLSQEAKEERYRLKVQTFSMLCYTFMSIHYSLKNSPFNSAQADIAGFLAAVASYAV